MIDFTEPSIEQSLHEANLRAEAKITTLREALERIAETKYLSMGRKGIEVVNISRLHEVIAIAREALLRAGREEK